MRSIKNAVFLGILAVAILFSAGSANAQVSVGVAVGPVYSGVGSDYGPAPVCDYGYYGYYPYACAPYGYYGPSYFVGGVFIGAGPWFSGFYGRGYYGYGYGRGYYGRDYGHGYYGGRGYYGHGYYGRPGYGLGQGTDTGRVMAIVQVTDTEVHRPADMSPMVTAVDSKAATAATGIASAETVGEASAATAADFTAETVDSRRQRRRLPWRRWRVAWGRWVAWGRLTRWRWTPLDRSLLENKVARGWIAKIQPLLFCETSAYARKPTLPAKKSESCGTSNLIYRTACCRCDIGKAERINTFFPVVNLQLIFPVPRGWPD